jgi:hypothetical protein
MSSIWVHLAGYSVNDHLPVKNGKAGYKKFWMITEGRLQVRETGENYLTNTTSAEYEFGGKVISEMNINDTLILVVDAGQIQFYIESERSSGIAFNNGYFGKFVKGKGRLSLGEYPYNMGVEEVKATPQQIIKVNIPQGKMLHNNGTVSIPMYLSPDEYNEADAQPIDEITDGNEQEAFYLIQYQLN